MKRFFTIAESGMILAWVFCVVHLLGGCSSSNSKHNELRETSMIEVLANPAKFDRGEIEIIGFLRLHPDGDLLLFHKDDYENAISSNALSLRIPEGMRSGIRQLNLNYVRIRGVIEYAPSAKNHAKSLCLHEIKLVELHSKPERPLALFPSDYARTATNEEVEGIKQGRAPDATKRQ